MVNYILKTSLVLLLSMLFFGCANTNPITDNKIFGKKQTLKVMTPKELSGDISLSVSALVMQMRHKKLNSRYVSFDKRGIHTIYEKDFKYRDFKWTLLNISKYKTLDVRGSVKTIRLEGVVYFTHKKGRSTSALFAMTYEIKNKKYIKILDSDIFTHFKSHPVVKSYFIPSHKYNAYKSTYKNFDKLLAFANKNAIRMTATKSEMNKYNRLSLMDKIKGKVPNRPIKGSFVVMTFCMERFPLESKFSLEVTADNSEYNLIRDVKNDITYLDYDGWKVGILGFNGTIRTATNPYFIKANYQTGENAYKQEIGKFSSAMSYKEHEVNSYPLSRGVVLLNLHVKDNAKLIQARLYALGHYRGKIDGDFGRNSKKALSEFVTDGLRMNYTGWNIEVQKRLFRNTGL